MSAKKDKEEKDKGRNDGRWRCPICRVEADIKDREIHVYVEGHTSAATIWPLHFDCEFANDIDHIDFSKLERVA